MVLQLAVVEGPDIGRSYDITADAVVGRDPTASVHLNDGEVSRRHAIVTAEGDGASIEDLGSSNGTWIGHERVDGTARLELGGRVRMGATILELREGQSTDEQPALGGEPAEPPATKVPLPDWREGSPG